MSRKMSLLERTEAASSGVVVIREELFQSV